MKLRSKWKAAIAVAATMLLAGCFNNASDRTMEGMDHSKMNMGAATPASTSPDKNKTIPAAAGMTTAVSTITDKEFTLTAQASNQEIAPGITVPVWTFNNSVPGPQIRVKQGDTVKITLKNELPEPATIHWHGIPVPNAMDGIPGMTQNAVQPGASFTYTFTANVPGTYWYHSHQDSVNQVDRGMYGSFIVEAKDDSTVDRDYTLVLDEWISTGSKSGTSMDMGNMSDMDHSQMNMNGSDMNMTTNSGNSMMMGHDMNMYDIYTINGRSGSLIEKLPVKQGDKVRLRLINAGYLSHNIHLHGHEFKVISADGQALNAPGLLKDNMIAIAPGERYDIEFKANNPGQWYIEDHSAAKGAKGMKAIIAYEGATGGNDRPDEAEKLPVFDLTRYGKTADMKFKLDQKYDHEYTMDLNTAMKGSEMIYTINGKTYPDIDPLNVKTGDTVKVRLVNQSMMDDHPMHLHGHFFQVLSKNGKTLAGSPVIKDTINLKPGEEVVVAFEADNPGDWMFHCHDLHHASSGMVTDVLYTDYKNDFVPDPNAGNKPE